MRSVIPGGVGEREATIGARMEGRLEAREAARTSGGPTRSRLPVPDVDPMRVAGNVMKTREANRARLKETEERDASD